MENSDAYAPREIFSNYLKNFPTSWLCVFTPLLLHDIIVLRVARFGLSSSSSRSYKITPGYPRIPRRERSIVRVGPRLIVDRPRASYLSRIPRPPLLAEPLVSDRVDFTHRLTGI